MMVNNEGRKNNFGSRQTIGKRSCDFVISHLVPIALLIIAMSHQVATPSNNLTEDKNFILGNFWIQVSLIALCLLLSSYLTGLNIGLLSFDKYGLLLMIYNGTKDEQRYARQILPYLHKKHQALITILVIKTFCESVFTLLLDNLVIHIAPPAISLVITAVSSALILLLLGEIIPQSIFLKYSLQISALTHGFIDTLWFLTWLISYPLSRILDAIIGDDLPKSSNQIFMLQEILDRVLINGDRIHIQIILRALAIDDVITSFINFNVQEIYGNSAEGIEDCPDVAAIDSRQGIGLKIYYSKKMPKFSPANISRVLLVSPELTFVRDEDDNAPCLQLFNQQIDFLAEPNTNSNNNNYGAEHFQNQVPAAKTSFIVVSKSISISSLLRRMSKSDVDLCIVTESSVERHGKFVGKKQKFPIGFIRRSDMVESVGKVLDDINQDKYSPQITDYNASVDSCTHNLTSNYSYQSPHHVTSPLPPFVLRIAERLSQSTQLLNGDDRKERILSTLSFTQNHLQFCSMNSSGFSHPSAIMRCNEPCQFVIFTLHGYMPVLISRPGSSIHGDTPPTADESSHHVRSSPHDFLKVYLPPFSLIGAEFLRDIAMKINNDNTQNSGLPDSSSSPRVNAANVVNLKDRLQTMSYLPGLTMLLPKSTHYATYLKLDINQIIHILT